jgi:Fe2+ transport system protein FeoA
MKTLDKVNLHDTATIAGFSGERDKVSRRFLELGFLRGQRVKIVAFSLQNRTALVEIRGYVLCVRRNLLERIVVE